MTFFDQKLRPLNIILCICANNILTVFVQCTDSNLAYVDEHRWPPLSYEQAMEQYRKKYLEEDEDTTGDPHSSREGGEEDSDEGLGGAGGKKSSTEQNTHTHKRTMKLPATRERCKVM